MMNISHLKQSVWFPPLVAFCAGVVTVLAFAPIGWSACAVLGVAGLLFSWENASPRQAFSRGFLFGVGLFGVGASWLYISVHTFGHIPVPFALLITGSFVAIQCIFYAALGWGVAKFAARYPSRVYTRILFIFPLAWSLAEMGRGVLFSGFPWFYLGVSQVNSPLGDLLPIIGTHGVSVVVCMLGAVIFLFCQQRAMRQKIVYANVLIFTLAVSFTLGKIEWTTAEAHPVRVSLLQGNITQDLKWNAQQLRKTLTIYRDMITQSLDSDVVVVPESGITLPPEYVHDYIEDLSALAEKHQTSLLLGIPLFSADKTEIYNGMLVKGQGSGQYLKRHLVLFGEYVPLKKLVAWVFNLFHVPLSTLSSGPAQQANLQLAHTAVAPLICIETAYPAYVLHGLPEAKFVLTVTDDSWFGHSFASAQHLQIAQALAKQIGRSVVQASNTGMTAIVNHRGEITAQIPPHQRDILTASVEQRTGLTPWSHIHRKLFG